MDEHRQDSRYEDLYTQLLERGMNLHMSNKKRIKVGLILLLILPVVLGIILKLTESDKIVFLIIWVICMFIICIYLISIEYIDDSIRKTLEEVTDREADFGELIADSGAIEERLTARREQIRGMVKALREERTAQSEKQESEDEK